MVQHLPDSFFIEKAQKIQQAMVFCYDDASNRIPIGLISSCTIQADNIISFEVVYFPVMDIQWNIFATELHFYKKEFPFSVMLYGIARFDNEHPGQVIFTLQRGDYFEKAGMMQQSLPEKVQELFSHTGDFIKKVISEGI